MNRPGNIRRLFVLILLLATASFANPPSPEAIQQVISASKLEWEKFENESFMLRMQFDLSGRLLDDRDKIFFCEFASNARNRLDQYVNEQQSAIEQIEKHEGADWEQKYGSTGLWRRLAAAVETTKLNRAQIDYLHTVICENSQPSGLVREQLFKRKLRSDVTLCEALKTAMEQIKYFGPSGPNEINDVAQSLAGSDCYDDPEMLLTLAILQRKFAPDQLKKTLPRSQTAILLGKLLLADMSNLFSQSPADVNFESISQIDAELAATAALQTDLDLYADLLTTLAQNSRFQSPAVLYSAAISLQDSQPQKTVELLIKAANSHLQKRNELLKITPAQMAEQAFNVAYHAFTENPNDCQPAINAFDNYSQVASGKINEQTRYLYGVLLFNCVRIREAFEMLTPLAEHSNTIWRYKARLALIEIRIKTAASLTLSDEILMQLRNFIHDCSGRDEQQSYLRGEAMDWYCSGLLSRESEDSARQALQILDTAEPMPSLPYELYRAQALKRLGRLEESAHFLVQTIDFNEISTAPMAVSLLSEILDKIELWQQNARDFNEMLENCARLSLFARESIYDSQTALIMAEISILQGKTGAARFLPGDENDVNWLRAKARLLMAHNDFNQSALLWAKIAEIRRMDPAELNNKSYGWWQAKFYELDCLAKSPDADKQNIAHTIDVLFNSFSDIPTPWAEKLDLLKKHCAAN